MSYTDGLRLNKLSWQMSAKHAESNQTDAHWQHEGLHIPVTIIYQRKEHYTPH